LGFRKVVKGRRNKQKRAKGGERNAKKLGELPKPPERRCRSNVEK